MKNGVLIGTYPIKIVLAGGLIGFIITTIAFKNVKNKLTKKDLQCNLRIKINNNYVFVKAIVDTGNFLKEPITKIPVIIVEKEALRNTIPDCILDNLDKIISGENIDIGEYISKIRIIPFSSLGKQNGILLGIKGELLIVNLNDKDIYIKDFIVGIYNSVLSKTGKYKALIGLEILDESKGEKNEYIRNIKIQT